MNPSMLLWIMRPRMMSVLLAMDLREIRRFVIYLCFFFCEVYGKFIFFKVQEHPKEGSTGAPKKTVQEHPSMFTL